MKRTLVLAFAVAALALVPAAFGSHSASGAGVSVPVVGLWWQPTQEISIRMTKVLSMLVTVCTSAALRQPALPQERASENGPDLRVQQCVPAGDPLVDGGAVHRADPRWRKVMYLSPVQGVRYAGIL